MIWSLFEQVQVPRSSGKHLLNEEKEDLGDWQGLVLESHHRGVISTGVALHQISEEHQQGQGSGFSISMPIAVSRLDGFDGARSLLPQYLTY